MRTGLFRTACLLIVGLFCQAAFSSGPDTGSVGGYEAKFIRVKGINTRYYEAGNGEPLLLVHGGPWEATSSANIWSRNLAGLSKNFHVLAPDRLGNGMTDNPSRKSEVDFNEMGQIRHLADFIETMETGPVNIVGQGDGGIGEAKGGDPNRGKERASRINAAGTARTTAGETTE